MGDLGAVAGYWLLLTLLGVVSLPMASVLFRNLPDRALFLAKPLGLLLACYVLWLLGSAKISITQGTAWLAVGLVAAANVVVWRVAVPNLGQIVRSVRSSWLLAEAVFAAAFLLWAVVRMHDPDITGTEQYMDFAFLNACWRSETMPPHDPWLSGAGNYINYYYFGYFMQATLAKLSGLAPEIAYNLSMASLFALLFAGAFALVLSFTRSVAWSALSGALVALLGNLDAARQAFGLRGYLSRSYGVEPRFLNLDLFASTRILYDRGVPADVTRGDYNVISEVPIFSYLWGDMHPHVMAMPYGVLALAVAAGLLRSQGFGLAAFGNGVTRWITLGLSALVLGSLWPMNAWDFPTYLGIAVGALWLHHARGDLFRASLGFSTHTAQAAVPLVLLAVLAFLPFTLNFASPQKFALWAVPANLTATSKLHQWLVVMGIPVFFLGGYLILRLRSIASGSATSETVAAPRPPARPPTAEARSRGSASAPKVRFCTSCGHKLNDANKFCGGCGATIGAPSTAGERGKGTAASGAPPSASKGSVAPPPALPSWLKGPSASRMIFLWLAAVAALGVVTFFAVHAGDTVGGRMLRLTPAVTALMVGAIAAALAVQRFGRAASPETFALLVLCFGAGLVAFCEHFFLKDVFANRMNTIFKFYLQAYVLFGVAAGILGPIAWKLLAGESALVRKASVGAGALLVLLGAFYPVMGIATQTRNFASEPALDGMRYLRIYHPDEHDALLWARTNLKGNPVTLEAKGNDYSEYGRVSANTGLPTVIGWEGHEDQWRRDWRGTDGGRVQDVDAIYTTPDVGQARNLLAKYKVEYVWVGRFEQEKYGSSGGLAKFEGFCEVAYRKGGVVIFRFKG